ncbi:Ig domain-containing protein [Burkholderia orbicola]|uniref:Ig domain-containing protein n=1 Tax=Burkholderia orbicola TaxID=2978683 RepID=UPI002FE1B497
MPIDIIPKNLTDGWVGASYKGNFTIDHPDPGKFYSFVAYAMPSGLHLSTAGEVSGTPQKKDVDGARFFVTLKEVLARNGAEPTPMSKTVLTKAFKIKIHAPLQMTPSPDSSEPKNWLRVGREVNIKFEIVGDVSEKSEAFLWSISQNNLLNGLHFDKNVLKGTLDAGITPSLRAADGRAIAVDIEAKSQTKPNKAAVAKAHCFVLYPAMTLSLTSNKPRIAHHAYHDNLIAENAGSTPKSRIVYGIKDKGKNTKLSWLTVDAKTGAVSGTPPAVNVAGDDCHVIFTATDLSGYSVESASYDFSALEAAKHVFNPDGVGGKIAFPGEEINFDVAVAESLPGDWDYKIIKTDPEAHGSISIDKSTGHISGNYPINKDGSSHFKITVQAHSSDENDVTKEYEFPFGQRIKIHPLDEQDVMVVASGSQEGVFEDFSRGASGYPFKEVIVENSPAGAVVEVIPNTPVVHFIPGNKTGIIEVPYTIRNEHDSASGKMPIKVVEARLIALDLSAAVKIKPGATQFVALPIETSGNDLKISHILYGLSKRGVSLEQTDNGGKVGLTVRAEPTAAVGEKINFNYVLVSSDEQVSKMKNLAVEIIAT